MIYTQFQSPGFSRWQSRLARVPRWAWVAFFLGALIPIVALIVAVIAFGLIIVAAALVIATIASVFYRLFHRPRRRSNEIVVRAVRVVDP